MTNSSGICPANAPRPRKRVTARSWVDMTSEELPVQLSRVQPRSGWRTADRGVALQDKLLHALLDEFRIATELRADVHGPHLDATRPVIVPVESVARASCQRFC